jgi:predicted secreted protein
MRYVIGLSFAALAVWVLQATGILMAIVVFLMVGAVPGTTISVPPTPMLIFLTLIAIAVGYWVYRQRPVKQIQNMKRAYHTQIDKAPTLAVAVPKQHRESIFIAGFNKGYTSTQARTYQWWRQTASNARRKVRSVGVKITKTVRPISLFVVALSMIILIASRELVVWIKPHAIRIAKWLRKQAGYSLKGTMLSAHKWSSLSKKLFSSLTSLLRRCSSVLKRGKSLLTRSAR